MYAAKTLIRKISDFRTNQRQRRSPQETLLRILPEAGGQSPSAHERHPPRGEKSCQHISNQSKEGERLGMAKTLSRGRLLVRHDRQFAAKRSGFSQKACDKRK